LNLFLPPHYQLINPKDLLKIDELGVIKEIYIPYSDWINNTRLTTETQYVLENNYDINVVQTNDLFCNKIENKCFIFNDELLYLDQVHLNIAGGQLITERLSTLLEK
jgi:lysophospholipase L1-like esterase